MIKEEEVYKIGRVGKPHGIKGELQVQVEDDVFDRVEADYLVLSIDGILVPFFMEEYRFKSDETVLVKFCDVDSQERARELTGCDVFFPRALADEDESGELSYAQLVGYMLVDDASGKTVGEIASIDDNTVNLLFELTDGTLIPAAEELITDIDTDKRTIMVQLPEGILSLNEG